MIQIEDYDVPIEVAKKIITGTKKIQMSSTEKKLRKAYTGYDSDSYDLDMFSLEEIREIAFYLLVFYNFSNREQE